MLLSLIHDPSLTLKIKLGDLTSVRFYKKCLQVFVLTFIHLFRTPCGVANLVLADKN